jgi:hypothetical protein
MVGVDRKNLFFHWETMRKENGSQGSAGKQGEINLNLKIGNF